MCVIKRTTTIVDSQQLFTKLHEQLAFFHCIIAPFPLMYYDTGSTILAETFKLLNFCTKRFVICNGVQIMRNLLLTEN